MAKKNKYETKEEALQHLSAKQTVAAKQKKMIEAYYGVGLKMSQNDLDNIELDCHQDNMRKAMSY